MILKNRQQALNNGQWARRYSQPVIGNFCRLIIGILLIGLFNFSTCKYGFKDTAPIPPEVKTFRVNYLENKARYVNAQLSPQLTEKLKQKILGNTRLRQTNDDNADYDISGFVSDYSVTTSGISGNDASTNRISVAFHVIFKNALDEKKSFESDVNNTFDFPATQSLAQAESALMNDMTKNIVDAVFNKIFSNW
ncbi:LPS assembly lipoprotein LptE [Ferruginibacter lapsinanis]|uniref:LPS assembly lipoprotein LptE n=1 Tax=Ferruginibacter lapsinanis TaxID=563172 RepID=UPI001E635CAA|nr:LPS assembly lipoprotein LptE [Ferruginibacter lapsinanis]UEG48902.1 LPS assembly lipoprotein LptE [Ferruginibacter lapsinanis]